MEFQKCSLYVILLIQLTKSAVSHIEIEITPPKSNISTTVSYDGFELRPISESEKTSFHLTEGDIQNILKNTKLISCGWLCPDTLCYSSKPGFSDIQVKLQPIAGKVKNVKTERLVIAKKEFINNSTVPAIFKGGIKQELQETVSTTWSKSKELSLDFNITYKIISSSFSYTSKWGEENSVTKTITIASSSDIEVPLRPGQKATAILTASQANLNIEVDYIASVVGNIACTASYYLHSGTYVVNVNVEVNKLLKSGGYPLEINSQELKKMVLYDDVQVVLKDKNSLIMLVADSYV